MHEDEIEEVDPKVTEFLLRKPWYAGTTYDTDRDADADADSDLDTERPRARALYEVLKARGINCPSEDQQRIDARMQAMGYSISPPMPIRARSSRSEDQGQGPVHFESDENDYQSDTESDESFDDTSRPKSSEIIVDVHRHQSYARMMTVVDLRSEDNEKSHALKKRLRRAHSGRHEAANRLGTEAGLNLEATTNRRHVSRSISRLFGRQGAKSIANMSNVKKARGQGLRVDMDRAGQHEAGLSDPSKESPFVKIGPSPPSIHIHQLDLHKPLPKLPEQTSPHLNRNLPPISTTDNVFDRNSRMTGIRES